MQMFERTVKRSYTFKQNVILSGPILPSSVKVSPYFLYLVVLSRSPTEVTWLRAGFA